MRSVNLLIKPASSRCNLRCRYCFYEDEAQNRTQQDMGMMTAETAERLLAEAYALAEPGGTVSFAFQGGEPTLAGLDFFRRFTALARERKPSGVRSVFSIQTNGILLDESWAEFFHREGFLVGLSLDGFEALHDGNRVDARGAGTWKLLVEKVRLLQDHQVETNALCVVTGACAKRAGRVYRSLRELGFAYLQFIACLDPFGEEPGKREYSLTPQVYGRFLTELFELWYEDLKAGRQPYIRQFENYIALLLGQPPEACDMRGICSKQYVVEADGGVYPCDFYVLDEYRLGNVHRNTFEEIDQAREKLGFVRESMKKEEGCEKCRYYALCRGGCRRTRLETAGNHQYFCEAYQMFFDACLPGMMEIASWVGGNASTR